MGPRTERLRTRAGLAALAVALAAPAARAQPAPYDAPPPPARPATPAPVVTASPAPAPASGPFVGARVEAFAGVGGPLGTFAGALVFQPTPSFALGAGAGAATGQPGGPYLALGAFARATLWRWGRFSAGPVITASGGNHVRDIVYQRPQYASADSFTYYWKPGYRLDGGVGGEAAFSRLSVRLEAGLGVYLNEPTCWYRGGMVSFWGACDAPEIPEPYHFALEPGRLVPYLMLSFGYNAGRDTRAPAAATPDDDDDAPDGPAPAPTENGSRTDTAWLAQTALTVPAGSVTATLYEAVLLRVTVGLHRRAQLWAGTSWTDLAGKPMWELGAKVLALDVARFRLALVAEHFGFRASGWTGLVVTGGGAVASACLDDACGSVLSLSAVGGWLYQDNDDSPSTTTTGALVSPSAVVAAGPVKLVAEAHLPWSQPRDGLWSALVRMPLGRVTLDVGALGTLQTLHEMLPAGSLGYRW